MAAPSCYALKEIGPIDEQRALRCVGFEATERLIGRSDKAHLKIPRAVVSRSHATIWLDADGELQIRDVGSTHGTFVNGRRIEPNQAEPLRVGDRVIFGRDQLYAVETLAADEMASSGQATDSQPVRHSPPTPTPPPAATGSLMDLALAERPADEAQLGSDLLRVLASFVAEETAAMTPRELLSRALQTMELLAADRCFALVGDGEDFSIAACSGVDRRGDPDQLVPNATVVARSLESGSPIVVFDGQTDPLIAEADRSSRARSALCMMVRLGDNIGALYADAQRSGQFGARELHFMQLLAAVVEGKHRAGPTAAPTDSAVSTPLPLRKRLHSHLNRLEMIADDVEHEQGQTAVGQLLHAEAKRLRDDLD